VGYFSIIYHYSVNVIIFDQWSDVTVINASTSHFIPWGVLWAQWNENRMFFPRLIVIVLADVVHFNIQFEEYLGAVMLLAATALLIWTHKRRSAHTHWFTYCPVALLTLSLVQYGNTLWGFQMAWYLVVLALAATIFLLDRVTLSWLTFIGATIAAGVGSFSLFQGLLIWPVGLVLLYHRRRAASFTVFWATSAVVALVVYFYKLNTHVGQPSPNYAWQHPLASLKFYLFQVGDVVGASVKFRHGNTAVLVVGSVILILAIVSIARYGIHRDEHGGNPIGVALICFGLLFAGSVTQGRIVFGYYGASASRYTTCDLLILVGIYLTLLGRGPALEQSKLALPTTGKIPPSPSLSRIAYSSTRSLLGRAIPVARWCAVSVIVLQIILALPNGLTGIRAQHNAQVQGAYALRNVDRSPDAQDLLDPFSSASLFQEQVRVAKRLHLSLFAHYGER
jgi:hypothetical protein